MFVNRKSVIITVLTLLIALHAGSGKSFAAEEIASFSNVKGEVRIKSPYRAKGKWLRVKKPGVTLFNGDEIKTLAGSAELTFNDGSLMKISENSSLSIEERPTRKKLFGFIDLSYMNRNIKVSFGKLWANVRKVRGMWTSFESKVAVAGIRGTTVSMYVDSRGDMQFSNEEGEVEISKHDGSFTVKMDRGKNVWIKGEEGDKTLVQSVNGDMGIYTDNVTIQLGHKNAIILGISGDETTVDTPDFNESSVALIANAANINLDGGESVNIATDVVKNETKIFVPGSSTGDIGVKITATTVTLDPGEGIVIQMDEVNETAAISILQSKDGVYIFNEDGRTYNLGPEDRMEVRTWDYTPEKVEPQYDPIVPPPPVEAGPASPVGP